MPDQAGVFLLITREFGEKFLGAGFCDGADITDNFIARHADAVVADRDGTGSLVDCDANLQIGIVLVERGIGDGREAQLVDRIGRIRDQFAQENFAVRVQRVNHELQELFDFGLER